MKTLIVTGGRPPSPELLQKTLADEVAYIIAADSGANVLLDHGIDFDLAVGDFDSLNESSLAKIKQNTEVITYEVKKDFTDTEAAYHEAVRHGATEVLILGATGTRMDHFMGNLALLQIALNQGVTVRLIDEHNELFLVQSSCEIAKRDGYNISVFPFGGEVADFSLSQVAYPLKHHHLSTASTLTVSNEFLDGPARLDFIKGTVLVILSRD